MNNVIINMCHPSGGGGGGGFFHDTSENVVTDNATPAAIDPDVFVTLITTDGSGMEQELTFPTDLGDAGADLTHVVILQTRTDPGDTVLCSIADEPFYLGGEASGVAVVRWQSDNQQWVLQYGHNIVMADEEQQVTKLWVKEAGGAGRYIPGTDIIPTFVEGSSAGGSWLGLVSGEDGLWVVEARDPNDIATYETLDLAGASEASSELYATYIVSGGTAGAESFSLPSAFISGHRKSISFDTQTDPADVPSLDPSNIVDNSNTQPTSITFNAPGDEILLEWQLWRDSNSGKWVIIGASSGVVT